MVVGDFNNDGRLDFAINSSFDVQASIGIFLEQPIPVAFYPVVLNFAPQTVGTRSPPQTVRFANVGPTPVNISQVTVVGYFPGTNNCPATLNPGASCTVPVTFTPGFVGVTGGLITITDDALGTNPWISLVGTGK